MSYQHGNLPVPTRIAANVSRIFGVTATAGLLASLGLPAAAQETQPIPKVEITGSSIKRLNAETALPVQLITRADIEATIGSGGPTVRAVTTNGGVRPAVRCSG